MRAKNRLDTLLMAATFAEAGEFETAKELLAPQRQVLLALKENQVAGHALQCAVNLCKRVDAALDVLLVSIGEEASTGVLNALADAGLPYRLIRGSGALGKEITRYVRSCRSVAFVVVDSLEAWGADKTAKPWRTLGCPVVVAADRAATTSHSSK
jgi:hypothetical protein